MFEEYKKYLVFDAKQGRTMVVLYKSEKDRTTISLARYNMCQKENRILEDWEEVDHIDDNTMNDNIDNLQILTRTENERKKKIGISCVELVCLFCKRKYLKESRQVKATSKYCSKNCFHRSMKR